MSAQLAVRKPVLDGDIEDYFNFNLRLRLLYVKKRMKFIC